MIDHDRFEILAGAVMLGEATDAERATFAQHAAICEPCRLDAAYAPHVVQTIERAKVAETWRPSGVDGILRRIRDSRTSRFGATVGVLGWAVALSIVLNVAFVSGLSSRIHDAFAPAVDVSNVSSMKIELESPAPYVAALAAPPARPATVAIVHRNHHRHVAVSVAAAASLVPAATAQSVPAAATDVPDVLAGLGVDGAPDDAKHVAVEPRCPSAPDPVATDASRVPSPCASAQELQR